MSPFTPTRLAAIGASVAAVTGTVAATPVASAAVTSISISTAGSKPINQATYAWGTVSDGAGVQACTQVLIGSSWSTSQCVTTSPSGAYTIPLTYGAGTPGTSSWRVIAGDAVSPTATLTRTGGSTTPSRPTGTTVDYAKGLPGGQTLYPGDNGVKVWLVQRALGVPSSPMSTTMGPQTIAAVKTFQSRHGLTASGNVDAQTFYAIKKLTGKIAPAYTFDIDEWKQPSRVVPGAGRPARIDAMLAFARAQVNLPYIWGGTGPMGYDCSGLLLQALRAGGYVIKDTATLSNRTDVKPPSNLSAKMYAAKEFMHIPVAQAQPGDFIYYSTGGVVGHVAMVLDASHVINAVDGAVRISPISDTFKRTKVQTATRIS